MRLGVTLAVLAAALPVAAPANAAEVGAVPDITWGIPRDQVDRTVAMMRDAGISTVRANISWAALEQNGKGQINQGALADADYAIDAARGAGLEVLMPVSDSVPYWASGDPAKTDDASGQRWNRTWRPRNPQDYADFMRFVVDRYSKRGVHAYEVWNEPNLERFWPSGVNAGEYVELLKAAYPAIKQADPNATVVLGGLSKSDYPFLEKLYAAGAKPYFDVAAVHPYTGRADPNACWNQGGTSRKAWDAFCSLEEVRRTMVNNGDSGKKIWLTEFGWSTYQGEWGVSEAEQAKYFTEALVKLESYPWVEKAFIYGFRNLHWSNNAPTDIEANFGLVRTDYSAKPALRAVTAYATTGGPATPPAPPTTPINTSPPTGGTAPTTTTPAVGTPTGDVASNDPDAQPATSITRAPVRLQLAASPRGRRFVVASGRVRGRTSGTVNLTAFLARPSGRFAMVARRRAPVRAGAFRARVSRFQRGRWRVQAVLRGAPSAIDAQRFRLEDEDGEGEGAPGALPPGVVDDGRRALGTESEDGSAGTEEELTGEASFDEPEEPGPLDEGGYLMEGAEADAEDVELVQERLSEAGFETLADGEFGLDTAEAVRRFQRAHGLLVDGIVGHQTMTALARYADAG